ncbi:MAG: transcriptional repressor [Firmicutes bacterium]|nr:transcriptional repressor [Bacillota bacterium]
MSAYEYYLDKIKQGGFKITQQRIEILKALSKDKMQSAEQLHNNVILIQPNVSLDTIYRNLHMFLKLGVVTETKVGDGKTRFKLSGKKHNHHMTCVNCGSSVELNFCPMDLIKDQITSKNFRVTNHNFEIFGYCSCCS